MDMTAQLPLSEFVVRKRLWDRHMQLGEIGAIGNGGVNRQALTAKDNQARRQVIDWAVALGAQPKVDGIGNIFLRFPGNDENAPAVMTGSHLDTQPTGGKFDGISGVLAGLEVLEALAASGRKLKHPIDLVIWNNEEGSRFSPATMGSGVYAGLLSLEDMLAVRDSAGVVLRDALAQTFLDLGEIDTLGTPPPVSAYLELHIEQGPVLERNGTLIGNVTGIQGLRQYRISIDGKAAHAGTTPVSQRQDALMSALNVIRDIQSGIDNQDDTVRFTIGRLDVAPGAPNTVASNVVFTIDLRHPDPDRLQQIEDMISRRCTQPGPCVIDLDCLIRSAPTQFDAALVASVRDSALSLGLTTEPIVSGATHDAMSMAALCPTAMIFVPCLDGESHNELEWAEAEHLWAGTCVLADTIQKQGMA